MGASLSISLRNGAPALVRWRCPITSSRVRGRIRTASGAAAWAAVSSASSNRLADWPASAPDISRPYLGSLLYHVRRFWGRGYPQAGACGPRLSTGFGAPGLCACPASSMGLVSVEPFSRDGLAQADAIARRQSLLVGIDPDTM